MMSHAEREQYVHTVNDRLKRRHRTCRRGFTLIQLLGVIVILAIPATILFPVIATPNPSEMKTDDDSSAVPALDQKEFIQTVVSASSNHTGLAAEITTFRAWVKETQGADVSFPAQGHGRMMIARFSVPSTRKVAVIRARRLHWYYTYLRRADFSGKDSVVKVIGSNGDTLAVCDGAEQSRSNMTTRRLLWLRMASLNGFRRLAAVTHRQ